MSVTKPQTEATDKTSSPPAADGAALAPDKQGGPVGRVSRFALSSSSVGAPGRARTASRLQRSIGNSRLSRVGSESETPQPEKKREQLSPSIQKLSVSSPNDPSEQEAESVARMVSAGRNAPPISTMGSGTSAMRKPEEKEEKQAGASLSLLPAHTIARDGEGAADTSTASSAIANKGAGSPISPAMRNTIEPHMGTDLSSARVHKDSAANEAAGSIGARAFTHGNDIFLGRGESENDTHLMAHEATHVAQQAPTGTGGALKRVAKGGAKAAAEVPIAPGVLELKGLQDFPPPGAIAQCLDEHKGSEVVVKTRFGDLAQGDLKVKQTKSGDFQIKKQPLPMKHPLFARVAEAAPGLEPSLIVVFDGKGIQGYVGLAAAEKLPQVDLEHYIEKAPDLIGLAGFSMPTVKLTNKLVAGQLHLGLENIPIKLGGAFSGTVSFDVIDEKITFDGKATIVVKGLAEGTLELKRNEENLITGKAKVDLQLPKNFKGSVDVAWDGRAITGEGKVGYTGEKLSGEVTLHLMERGEAAELEKEKKAPPEAAGKEAAAKTTKAPGQKPKDVDYVVFGEGDLTFAFNEWLTGEAHVIVDPKGYVTIIGKITPQKEFELFEQKDFVKPLFKFEARASYGLPVIGNIFIFANVGMDAFAKLGPAKFYNIVVEGTYSTDPDKNKDFSIKGSINISAAAGLRLRAEAGAGLEILGHDIKVGAGINGIAGIKAYAEATPVIGYREKGAPGEDKKGEFYIRGDLELAAQPFLGLSGDVFLELDTPWWSPLSDDKWTWPLFDKEYPLGGSLGMMASVDYVFGSKEWPAIEFKPVEFDSSKFMTDLYHDETKPKTADAGDQKGEWKEKNEGATEPPKQAEGDAKPGKVDGKTAKPLVEAGGPKGKKRDVDDHAVTADGKKVEDLKKKAVEKGKTDPVKGPKGTAHDESKDEKAKDPKKEEQSDELKKGLAALDAVTAHYAKTGAEKEEVIGGVKSVRRKFKVFKSIEVVEGDGTWDYEYVYNPTERRSGPPREAEIPTRRYLPNEYDVRAKLYERGSGWKTTRNSVFAEETGTVKERIESILEDQNAGKEDRAVNRVRALVREEKLPEAAVALLENHKLKPSYVDKVDYHVDHITPLAEHWKTTGYDSGDKSRWNKTVDGANLRLITQEANLSKGGEGHHYGDKPYVGKNFVSDYAASGKHGAKSIDGQPFRDTPPG
jgi:hypothetical protein